MADLEHLQIHSPHIVWECLDGEAVLVNFQSGSYYSVRDSGTDVLNSLVAGASVRATIDMLATHYQLSPEQVAPVVRGYVAQLVAEQLLVPAPPGNAPAANSMVPSSEKFSLPPLEKFDDMADQLLLDPIHDLDGNGWPAAKSA